MSHHEIKEYGEDTHGAAHLSRTEGALLITPLFFRDWADINLANRFRMNGGSFGDSFQQGGLSVIDPDEAFLVFGKWTDERTSLRVDGESPALRFSCFGVLKTAPFPMIRLGLDSLGFIDIHLPESTHFDYCDPDSLRLDIANRIGQGSRDEPTRYGAGLFAARENGESFLFVEVLGGI